MPKNLDSEYPIDQQMIAYAESQFRERTEGIDLDWPSFLYGFHAGIDFVKEKFLEVTEVKINESNSESG